ncbi:MAG: ATP-dependent Clp protease ATP-binding subunit [Patescibacteria group bacterium]
MSLDLADLMQNDVADAGIPGVLIDGHFWYWDGVIDADAIAYRAQARGITKMLRIVGAIGAVLSFVIFLIGIVTVHATDLLTLSFWTTPHIDLFAFWIGILFTCFIWYKTRSIAEMNAEIPRIKHNPPEKTAIPSLAATSMKNGMFCALTDDAVTALEDAFDLAQKSNHADVSALHMFAGATSDRDVRVLFARLGVSLAAVIDPLRRKMAALPTGETGFRLPAITVVRDAFFAAATHNVPRVAALDVFAACYEADEFLQEVFFAAGVDHDAFQNALAWLRIQDALRRRYQEFRKAASLKPTGNMDRAYTAVATPFLDGVSEDLTRDAVYGRLGFCVGREFEITAALRAIEGGRQSVVLVGSPGVGKGSIIDGIAELMVAERVPDILKDKRLLKLNVAHIVSAQGGNGAEERLLFALQEVAMSGNIVLVIENIHELVGIGGSIDLSSILAGELEKGYTFVLATATPSGYVDKLERSSLGPKLQRITVDEPERNLAIQIVESHAGMIESQNGVAFTYQAIAACIDLATRYLHDNVLPTSALEIARDAAFVVGKKPKEGPVSWVTREDVAARVSEKSKVPVTSVSQDEGQKLLQLESRLHERVVGQEQAIKAISSALRRARTELRSGSRPMANFLFLGPTGVGKTELAKTTSEVYFGNENAMVRFDMSEYQDQASVARLIGGNGQAGLLTEAIRRAPFSLLLLDELEKAHPDILNLFLQVMDDGRLTDGLGRTIDFTNVILIATSNAGTQFIQDEVKKGTDLVAIKTALMENELRQIYRPEFLNRFDDVIVFTPLTADDVAAIAYLMVNKIEERIKAKGLSFRIDDEAIHELAALGYDPKFGARPLRRVLQERVENVIAERILQGDVGRRDTVVYRKGGEVTVEKAAAL